MTAQWSVNTPMILVTCDQGTCCDYPDMVTAVLPCPHLNVYALATGAASPGYTLVPRAGIPRYTFVPRAGSPEYTPVIGLVALIT